jgi:serine/threonine-protein kinase
MPLANTEGGQDPFFSPDGKWVGFFTSNAMKKVPVAGGPAVRLAQVDNYGRGADWGPDGRIVYARAMTMGCGWCRTPARWVRRITMLDRAKREGSHRFPHLLPDGVSVLLTVGTGGSWDDASIELLNLNSGERRLLIEGGSDARYIPTGHLVYQRGGALLAVPFDLKTLTVTGAAAMTVQTVMPSTNNTGSAQAAISGTGSLMYVSGTGSLERSLVWVDRSGVEERLPLPPRAYRHPRISPDGERLVLDIDEGNKSDIWIYDLSRGTLERATLDGQAQFASWTGDGKKILFLAANGAVPTLFWKDVGGSGAGERLIAADHIERGASWSKDGDLLTFTIQDAMSGWDVWTLSLKGGRKPSRFTSTPFNETDPAFSPDGKWIAYQSDESGKDEVYVQPFSADGSRILVSTDGGMEPLWSADGRELLLPERRSHHDGRRDDAADVSGGQTDTAVRQAHMDARHRSEFRRDVRRPPLPDDRGERAGGCRQSLQHRAELV